jgi:hypothetical protein
MQRWGGEGAAVEGNVVGRRGGSDGVEGTTRVALFSCRELQAVVMGSQGVGAVEALRVPGWMGQLVLEWMRTARGEDGVLMTSHDDVDRCGWREFP